MVISGLFDLIKGLVNLVLSIFPNLPDVPSEFSEIINYVLDLIFESGASILGLFVHINTIKILVPLVIVIVNFEQIYKLIMWIVKKIPLSIS